MILPIVVHGHSVLKRKAQEVDRDYPDLDKLINNMFESMQSASGVGLAAPQINLAIRLFVIDASPFGDEYEKAKDFNQVFINPKITKRNGPKKRFDEGCLSFPGIREIVVRESDIRIEYYDGNFDFHDEEYDDVIARIIQHEYDHLEGITFIDRISSLRKTLLKRKLSDISKGNVKLDYKMTFPSQRKKKN